MDFRPAFNAGRVRRFPRPRDPDTTRLLAAALRRGLGAPVKSLRRDPHGRLACWERGVR
jgi:hypothetical protein